MKLTSIGLTFCMLALGGCQTVDPNSPQALKRAEYERIHMASTRANCTLVMELNKQRAAQKKALASDNRCASILMNNSRGGRIHLVNFVPDMSFNGIPLPLGGLMKLAVQADRNERENKAIAATLPPWASESEGTKVAYRFLLFLKFSPEEIATLKSSAAFADAARKNELDMQFAKENPELAKEVQKSDS